MLRCCHKNSSLFVFHSAVSWCLQIVFYITVSSISILGPGTLPLCVCHSLTLCLSFKWNNSSKCNRLRLTVCPSVCPFVSTLSSKQTDRWPWTFAYEYVMTIARKGQVKVMVQANAVGPTSIKGSFFLVDCYFITFRSNKHFVGR